MNKALSFLLMLFSVAACNPDDTDSADQPSTPVDGIPRVTSSATYSVSTDADITYAEGLVHNQTSTTPFSSAELGDDSPHKLDVYYPDTSSTNRPLFMFIHGGGFVGGTKTKPEIVEMGNYYASRGWVFASIDYRTTEELCDSENMAPCEGKIRGMTPEGVVSFYAGIAPSEWVEHAQEGAQNLKQLQQSIAIYAAQRDAKAALRWLVANASTYGINTDFITVGGASAGSITALTLGVSNQDDFRDEVTSAADPTLSTTNLSETFDVKSLVHFWGSTQALYLHEGVYDLEQYDRFDSGDPELFMAHGTAEDPVTPYEGAIQLQSIYSELGVHSDLKTILLPNGNPAGHGAWNGVLDGQGLSELTFDFLVERQGLNLE